jgi:hypothetical protein
MFETHLNTMAASTLSRLHIGLLFLALWISAVFCIKGLGEFEHPTIINLGTWHSSAYIAGK